MNTKQTHLANLPAYFLKKVSSSRSRAFEKKYRYKSIESIEFICHHLLSPGTKYSRYLENRKSSTSSPSEPPYSICWPAGGSLKIAETLGRRSCACGSQTVSFFVKRPISETRHLNIIWESVLVIISISSDKLFGYVGWSVAPADLSEGRFSYSVLRCQKQYKQNMS